MRLRDVAVLLVVGLFVSACGEGATAVSSLSQELGPTPVTVENHVEAKRAVTPSPLEVPQIVEPVIPIGKKDLGEGTTAPCWDLEAAGFVLEDDPVEPVSFANAVRSRAVGWALITPETRSLLGEPDGDIYFVGPDDLVSIGEAAAPSRLINSTPLVRSLLAVGYEAVLVSVNDFGGIDHTSVLEAGLWESVYTCHRSIGLEYATAIRLVARAADPASRSAATLAYFDASLPVAAAQLSPDVADRLEFVERDHAAIDSHLQREVAPAPSAKPWEELSPTDRSVLDAPIEIAETLSETMLRLYLPDAWGKNDKDVICALGGAGWSGCVALDFSWGQNEGIETPDYLPLPILAPATGPVSIVLKAEDAARSNLGTRLLTLTAQDRAAPIIDVTFSGDLYSSPSYKLTPR